MKASSPSSSYSFGYAALDWCCDDGGSASLLSDDKHAPLHSDGTSSPQKPKSSQFFRRRAVISGMDSNSSASTASTQDDISTEPLIVPVDPITIWEPHASTVPDVVRSDAPVTRDVPPLPPAPVGRPPVNLSKSDRAERALGPIDLDALEEEATEQVPHPSSSQDSTLGSLNTNSASSVESHDCAPEKQEAAIAVSVMETQPPALAAAATISESPTDLMESSHVVEDPLLLLLLSQGPERSEKRDPAQLDALLQNILQDDELTLASSTAQPQMSGDLMDALAAGPVDVDDFIPEDSYWSMNTQDFVLDEVELSRQLAGYQEGCEPPCIDHVDSTVPASPPRARMTRQRTAATAETSELFRRAHVMQQQHRVEAMPLRRPDVVRRHVTAPSATRSVLPHPGIVRPTVTHPGVGRPTGASVRPTGLGRPTGASVRPQRPTGLGRPTGESVRPSTPATQPATPSGVVRRPQVYVPPRPLSHPAPQRAVPHAPQRPNPQSPQRAALPPALRKERRWLPESAAEV